VPLAHTRNPLYNLAIIRDIYQRAPPCYPREEGRGRGKRFSLFSFFFFEHNERTNRQLPPVTRANDARSQLVHANADAFPLLGCTSLLSSLTNSYIRSGLNASVRDMYEVLDKGTCVSRIDVIWTPKGAPARAPSVPASCRTCCNSLSSNLGTLPRWQMKDFINEAIKNDIYIIWTSSLFIFF